MDTVVSLRKGLNNFPPEVSRNELANQIYQSLCMGPMTIQDIIFLFRFDNNPKAIASSIKLLMMSNVTRHKINPIHRSNPEAHEGGYRPPSPPSPPSPESN